MTRGRCSNVTQAAMSTRAVSHPTRGLHHISPAHLKFVHQSPQGNGATMLHRLPYSAINFWAYERITELWNRRYPAVSRGGKSHNYSLDVTRRLMAGGAAGMCACTVVRAPCTVRIDVISMSRLWVFYHVMTLSEARIVKVRPALLDVPSEPSSDHMLGQCHVNIEAACLLTQRVWHKHQPASEGVHRSGPVCLPPGHNRRITLAQH